MMVESPSKTVSSLYLLRVPLMEAMDKGGGGVWGL